MWIYGYWWEEGGIDEQMNEWMHHGCIQFSKHILPPTCLDVKGKVGPWQFGGGSLL